jgi:peptide/nickel transport system permease protein
MLAYAVRRLLIGLVTLVLISFTVYGLIRAMPGDPTALYAGGAEGAPPLTVSDVEFREMRKSFGLDRHWTVAYLEWAGRTVRGDLGLSLHRRRPVLSVILEAIGPTLLLSGVSLVLAYILSIPLGIYAAHRSGRPDERALSAVLYVLYSFPAYVIAAFLVILLGVKLRVLPVSGMRSADHDALSAGGKLLDLLRHMAMPVACYTLGSLAYLTRFIRSNMVEALRQDYIRTARAKGLPERAVLFKHAFRNTLIPLVTLIGLSFPALLSGSIIIERIFTWPGMGQLFFEAIRDYDYPLIMGLTMMFSVLILLGTLLADLLYAAVDPRIAYS